MDYNNIIKEEPLEWYENDAYYSCGYPVHSIWQSFKDQLEGKTETNCIMDDRLRDGQNITAFAYSTLPRVAENIITVNVSESVKTEDEISFIRKVIDEENKLHDPALILPTTLEMYAKQNQIKPEKKQMHQCRRKDCLQLFYTLTERALHETHEHASVPRNIKCNLCRETFKNFFDVTRHMADHRDIHRYICSQCSKEFTCYQELQIHWKTSVACKDKEQVRTNAKESKLNFAPANTKEFFPFKHDKLMQKNEKMDLRSNLYTDGMKMSTTSPQPLSFADEVKAFAAKYQLKTVARKRTSAFIAKPVPGRKRKNDNFYVEPKYAIPKAAENSILPFPNLKIKQEPIDDEIEIKNEPHDDYEYFDETNSIANEEIVKTTPANQCCNEFPLKANLLANNIEPSNQLQNITETKDQLKALQIENPNIASHNDNNSINQTMETLKTIVTAGQRLTQPHPKIMLSKAKLLSMKNVKILKLGPAAKIFKLSPSTSPTGSDQEKQHHNNSTFTCNGVLSTPVEADINLTNIIPPDKVKIENKTERADTTFAPFTNNGGTDDKSNVILNVVEDIIQKQPIKRHLPKWLIRFMEEQPQKKKIIDELQREFQNANEVMKTNMPVLPPNVTKIEISDVKPKIMDFLATSNQPTPAYATAEQEPESFFLKVTDSSDKELMIARRQFQNYFYAWICPMCYKEYTQKHTFINHLIGTHKIGTDKLKALTVEVKPFLVATVKAEQNISSIQKRENEEETLKACFECPKCKRTYMTKQAMFDHQNSDCGRMPLYVCTMCSKPFASQSTLNCHMSIHTGELRYQCKYCDKRFRTNGQVRVHLRKHTGEKPFKCQICTLAFRHRETLISHLSRHMDIKRYICNGCNKRFSTISALTTHRNVRPTTCGSLELNTQAVGPLIRVTHGQIKFEPQINKNGRSRRKICQEILNEIQNIPKIKTEPPQQKEASQDLEPTIE